MDQKIMGAGVVSLLVGFALGNVTADRSPKMEDIRAALGAEMEAAGNTYTIEVYSNAPHAFTVFGSERYQERADTASWEAFKGFLSESVSG